MAKFNRYIIWTFSSWISGYQMKFSFFATLLLYTCYLSLAYSIMLPDSCYLIPVSLNLLFDTSNLIPVTQYLLSGTCILILLPSTVPVKFSASQVELRLALVSLYSHPPGQVYLSPFSTTFDAEICYGSFIQPNEMN